MTQRKKTSRSSDAVLKELRAFGLAYPGAHTKSPWPGHLDLAVNDKTFAYLSIEGEPLTISCKLPHSNAIALMLPFVTPAAYGLGKSGWVFAQFGETEPPVEMLKAWIDESYRAQAPKKLVAALGPPPEVGSPTSGPVRPAGKGEQGARAAAVKVGAVAATGRAARRTASRPGGTKPARTRRPARG
jgi:predicted DNA-binding protein (MmcQ/YjbR family)